MNLIDLSLDVVQARLESTYFVSEPPQVQALEHQQKDQANDDVFHDGTQLQGKQHHTVAMNIWRSQQKTRREGRVF
ncbi:hypothetical protein [Pseudomonas sp.]|uniref:hypothetical protein n=1 Tax=Pseudomonas sp. TaxID=306 RepID=UPI0028AEA28D|nr:hypothetical protein [Pseudomonas sp.]